MNRFLAEFRASLDGNKLVGHAAVFDHVAEVRRGQYEQLAHTAFDAVLKDHQTDVRALVNHDPSMVLGRQSAGTLKLGVDDEGLTFEVDLPDTSYARDLRELVGRGDVTGASFGFIPGKDEYKGEVRTHTSIAQLLDVSAVTWPAYEQAGVALRFKGNIRRDRKTQLLIARHRALYGLRRPEHGNGP